MNNRDPGRQRFDRTEEHGLRVMTGRGIRRWLGRRWPLAGALTVYAGALAVLYGPTLGAYFWLGHEQFFPVLRVARMAELWRAQGPLQTPWLPDLCFGYGWPFFTFYAPLGYYAAVAVHFLFGVGYGVATRLSFYAAHALSGLMMLGWMASLGRREDWPRPAGWALAAALLYALAPLHLADVFIRANLAQCWGWAALPGLCWALDAMRRRPGAGIWWAALAGSALILAHNITALWGGLVAAGYGALTIGGDGKPKTRGGDAELVGGKRTSDPWDETGAAKGQVDSPHWPRALTAGNARDHWRYGIAAAAAAGLALAMTAAFWLPAVRLLPLVRAADADAVWSSPADLRAQAVRWEEYFTERYTVTRDEWGMAKEFPRSLGLLLTAAAAAAAAGWARALRTRRGFTPPQRRRLGAVLALTGLLMVMMSPWMPWGLMPATLRYIQFPWRLTLAASCLAAAALAMAAPALPRWVHPAFWILPCLAIGLGLAPRALIQPVEGTADQPFIDDWVRMWEERLGQYGGSIANEYAPVWVEEKYLDPAWQRLHPPPPERVSVADGQGGAGRLRIIESDRQGTVYRWHYETAGTPAGSEAGDEGTVEARVHVFDFPGWHLWIDGAKADQNRFRTADGLVGLRLPAGRHVARLEYTLSPIGARARRISIAGWAVWTALGLALAARWRLAGQRGRRVPGHMQR